MSAKIERVTYESLSFTTERKPKKTTINLKRKGSTVREKCQQLINDFVLPLFPDRIISDEDLTCLIEDHIGGNRGTIRDYKGYSGHIRVGRCGDNTRVGIAKKGYLEKFGFMHRSHGVWIVHAQTAFTQANWEPIFEKSQSGTIISDSGVSGFKDKISLSQCVGSSGVVEGSSSKINDIVKSNNNNNTQKEIFFTPKICPKIPEFNPKTLKSEGLLPELERLAAAKPCDEPDRSTRIKVQFVG